MRTINNYILLLLLIPLMLACQEQEELTVNNKGFLRLEVAPSLSVNTKAESVYDAEQIAVKIIDKNSVIVQQTDDWETWSGKNIELPTGEYTIQASSNGFDGKVAAFNKPYYAGSKKIVIEKGKTVAANVICTLANVKVSVSFSKSFREAFKAGTVQIGGKEEGATFLSFLTSDNLTDKYAYFPVEPLVWSITVKNKNDVSKTMKNTIEEVNARDYFKFNFTIASSSNITISVDNTTKDYNYTVGIPIVASEFKITTNKMVNVWNRFAEINGQILSQTEINSDCILFKYKEANKDAWETVKPTVANTTASLYIASANISELLPATMYEYVLCYDDGTLVGTGDTLSFTTETETPLYNGNLDIWNKPKNTWFAATIEEATSKNSFWDSGNIGTSTGLAALAGAKNPTSPEETIVHTPSGKSGKLASQFVGLGSAGQFAAGNLYTGHFVKVIGTSGAEIQFGQPFISRPTKFHGWFQYSPGTVDYVGPIPAGVSISKGDIDMNAIYIALSDKGSPYTINTSDSKFINYDTDPNIRLCINRRKVERVYNRSEVS
jgi:Domain of unknown function (DUF4493)/Putative carbohydrate metabolism domain